MAAIFNFSKGIWFNIINEQKEINGQSIAIDVDQEIVNCPGAALFACPLVPGRLSQHWKWYKSHLVNRANGMAIDIKNNVAKSGQPLIVFYLTDTTNQIWKKIDRKMFSGIDPNFTMAVDTYGESRIKYKSLRGHPMIIAPENDNESQMFRLIEALNDRMY
ncbi:hypothetical protein CHUAL_001142 [Chamberlinius hualienensis]